MGILFGLVFLCIGLTAVAGFIGAVIWAYRKFGRKETTGTSIIPATPLVFPAHFGWALSASLLGFHIGLYSYLTYLGPEFRVPAAGWLVFTLFSALTWVILLRKSKSLFVYSTIGATVLASLFLFLRANGFVQTWDLLFFLLSQVLLFIYYTYQQLPLSVGGWVWSVIFTIPLTFMQGLRVLSSVFKKDHLASRSNFFGWVKTGIIAFIVLVIFLSLLSQADPVFAEVMREFRSQLIGRWLWTLFLIFLFSAWWSTSVSKSEEKESQAAWLSYRDVVAILGVVTILVGIFLAVQFQYLFGGSRELLVTLDMTFSEYVRKGFTELLLAVFIGGILSYLAGAKLRSEDGKNAKVIEVLNTVMVVELGLLLMSAFKRDMLYVETYGLTRVRVMGEIFLVWLAFFLVVLLVYSWKKIREKVALTALWVGALLVLVSINLMNVDHLVVAGAPGHHEYTDYFYLMQLSEDAAPAWPGLLKEISADVAPLLAKESLTVEERAQLAGLKLAVASFIENRDVLYTKYASSEWLLENHKRLGLELPSKENQTYSGTSWSSRAQIMDVIFPYTQDLVQLQQQKPPVIPESLEKYRAWQFTNYAEKKAFQLLESNQEEIFSVPERIFGDIIKYQLHTQTNLAEHENRLLYDLKYQFITVGLQRYYPLFMNHFEPGNWQSIRGFVRQEFATLEQESDVSVAELASLGCASPQVVQPREFTVYAAARKMGVVPANPLSGQQKAYELRVLSDTTGSTPAIQVLMPVGAKIGSMLQNPDEEQQGVKDISRAGMPLQVMPDYQFKDSPYEQDSSFVKAKLVPVAVEDGTGCKVHFQTSDMRAFYSF